MRFTKMPQTLEDRTFALQQYDTLLQIRPDDVDLWLGKAKVLSNAGQREGELECYDRVLELSPQHRRAAHSKLDILVETAVARRGGRFGETNRKDEANRFYQEMCGWGDTQGASDIFYQFLMGHAAGGSFRATDFYYDWALEVWQNHLPTLFKKMELYAQNNKKQEAIEFCDEQVKLHYKEAWPWYLRGFMLNRFGEYAEAIGCLDNALKIKPDNDIIKEKVSALEKLNRHAEAAGILGGELQRNPENLEYLVWRGSLLIKAGLPEQAAETYETALRINPNQPNIWLGKARLHKEIADKKFWQWWENRKAIKCYKKAKQLGAGQDSGLEELIKDHNSRTLSAISSIFTGGVTGGLIGLATALGQPTNTVAAATVAGGALGTAIALPFHLAHHKEWPALWYGAGTLLGLFGAGVGWAIGANSQDPPWWSGGSYDPLSPLSNILNLKSSLSNDVLEHYVATDYMSKIHTWESYDELRELILNAMNQWVLTHHLRGALLGGVTGTLIGTPFLYFGKNDGLAILSPFIGAAAVGWPLSLYFGWGWGGIGGGLLGGVLTLMGLAGYAEQKKKSGG